MSPPPVWEINSATTRITKVMPAPPLINFLPLKRSKLILFAIPKPADPNSASFFHSPSGDHRSKDLNTVPATLKTYHRSPAPLFLAASKGILPLTLSTPVFSHCLFPENGHEPAASSSGPPRSLENSLCFTPCSAKAACGRFPAERTFFSLRPPAS